MLRQFVQVNNASCARACRLKLSLWLVRFNVDKSIQISYNLKVLSQTAEYALRAVVTIARDESAGKTAQEIARESQVPLDYLSKVLNSLARAGIVKAQRGRGGGF